MGVWDEIIASANASKAISKTIFIIGGSERAQTNLIDKLYIQKQSFLDSSKRNSIANNFLLGYSYIHYKDQNDEIISTLQIYSLPNNFFEHLGSVLKTVLKTVKIEDLLIIPLLDYSENVNSWLLQIQLSFKLFKDHGIKPSILLAVIDRQLQLDWDPEIHEYIQICLRSVAHVQEASIVYVNSNYQNSNLLELVSILLELPTRINQKFQIEPSFVNDILIPKNSDSWSKISTLSEIINPQEEIKNWNLDDTQNKFIRNYMKIVPSKDLPTKVIKDRVDEHVKILPLDDFLQEIYERKSRESKVASVLGK